MKKLKLKLDGIKDMLTKEQMKKISGGYYICGSLCACYCDQQFLGCYTDNNICLGQCIPQGSCWF